MIKAYAKFMRKISEKSKEITAITIIVLIIQFPILLVNDGKICVMETFYMMTTAMLFGIFITHFIRKE